MLIFATTDITCLLGARVEPEVCLNVEFTNYLLRSSNTVCGLYL